jgi:hypothetical protein
MASRGGSTQAGQGTQWPRTQDAQRAPQAADQAQWAAQQYHYPAPAGQETGHLYPPTAPRHQAAAPQQAHAAPHTQSAAGGQEYAPQFARYSGTAEAARTTPPAYGGQATAGRGAAQQQQWAAERGHPQPQPHAGHAQQQSHADAGYWARQGGDARGFEQAGYVPPQAPEPAYGQAAQYGQPQQGYPQAHADPHSGFAQPGYQQQGYSPQAGQDAIGLGIDGYGYGGQQQGYDPNQPMVVGDPAYDAIEPPPKKRRGLMVAGALVCAVAVGGGLAFVYKTFGQGGKRLAGAPPLVTKPATPTKVAASDPGGRPVENTNKKFFDRVPGGAEPTPAAAPPAVPGLVLEPPSRPAPPTQTASVESAGSPTTRQVRTVPIGADGAPTPPAAQPAQERPVQVVAARPTSAIPGVMLDGQSNQPPGLRGSEVPPTPAAAPAQPKPKAPPKVAAVPAEPASAPASAAAPVRKAVPKASPPPASVGAVEGGGYVAVLSSQKDRMAALRAFADLQQKFPSQLGDKQPEVQEANLGEKGVWHRLVAGPPSSQQSANDLCGQLKSAGYSGCWTKKY